MVATLPPSWSAVTEFVAIGEPEGSTWARRPRQSPVTGRARQDAAIADRLLDSSADLADPAGWAQLAGQAAALRNEAQRFMRARTTIDRLLHQSNRYSRGHGRRGSTRARAKPVAGARPTSEWFVM